MKVIQHTGIAFIAFLESVSSSFLPIHRQVRSHALPKTSIPRHVEFAARARKCECHRITRLIGHASLESSLQAIGVDTSTLTAAGAIVASTAIGMAADKKVRYLRGAGSLITILAASHLSNLGLSPISHPFYELCWTKFLPASLALLLLAPTIPEEEQGKVDMNTSTGASRTRDAAREEIGAVSVPFVIGCLGSILGCLVSYFISLLGKENRNRIHSHILTGRKHFFWLPGHLLLQPTEAAVAAGCLCSSYIGGERFRNLFAEYGC